jgi:predicted DNA-binding transcriptional regulator YafY
MRRADRLFKIIQRLRRRSTVTTARELAEALEVSERTIYRDIAHLVDSGTPIRGEAGVGYLLERTFDLPPLMFDEQEIEALVLGARIVRSWSDPALAVAAEDALAKVQSALPQRLRERIDSTPLFAFNFRRRTGEMEALADIRRSIHRRRRLRLDYEDGEGTTSQRTVRPLGLFYWGVTWTLGAWCELRTDFRSFRIDRIRDFEPLEPFADEAGKTLADLFRHHQAELSGSGSPPRRT